MVNIALKTHWNYVSILKVCNKRLIPGKLALTLTYTLIKECIDKDVVGNTGVPQHAVISIESLENTEVFAGPYNQVCC